MASRNKCDELATLGSQQGVLLHIWELGVELTKLRYKEVPSAVILMKKP
jgi:hypothetical protein